MNRTPKMIKALAACLSHILLCSLAYGVTPRFINFVEPPAPESAVTENPIIGDSWTAQIVRQNPMSEGEDRLIIFNNQGEFLRTLEVVNPETDIDQLLTITFMGDDLFILVGNNEEIESSTYRIWSYSPDTDSFNWQMTYPAPIGFSIIDLNSPPKLRSTGDQLFLVFPGPYNFTNQFGALFPVSPTTGMPSGVTITTPRGATDQAVFGQQIMSEGNRLIVQDRQFGGPESIKYRIYDTANYQLIETIETPETTPDHLVHLHGGSLFFFGDDPKTLTEIELANGERSTTKLPISSTIHTFFNRGFLYTFRDSEFLQIDLENPRAATFSPLFTPEELRSSTSFFFLNQSTMIARAPLGGFLFYDLDPSIPQLNLTGKAAHESEGVLHLRLELETPSAQVGSFTLNSVDQEAEACNDYLPITNMQINVDAGQQLIEIDIPIIEDAIPEQNEGFKLVFSDIAGIHLPKNEFLLTILGSTFEVSELAETDTEVIAPNAPPRCNAFTRDTVGNGPILEVNCMDVVEDWILPFPELSDPTQLQFSINDDLLAVAASGTLADPGNAPINSVDLYSTSTQQLLHTFENILTPDGSDTPHQIHLTEGYLIANGAGANGVIRIFDTTTMTEVPTAQPFTPSDISPAFTSPTHLIFLSEPARFTILKLDGGSFTLIPEAPGEEALIFSPLSFDPIDQDGNTLFQFRVNKGIFALDLNSGASRKVISAGYGSTLHSSSSSSGPRHFAAHEGLLFIQAGPLTEIYSQDTGLLLRSFSSPLLPTGSGGFSKSTEMMELVNEGRSHFIFLDQLAPQAFFKTTRVNERSGSQIVHVALSEPSSIPRPFTGEILTLPMTSPIAPADLDGDFGNGNIAFNFPVGITEVITELPILNDHIGEVDEGFLIALSERGFEVSKTEMVIENHQRIRPSGEVRSDSGERTLFGAQIAFNNNYTFYSQPGKAGGPHPNKIYYASHSTPNTLEELVEPMARSTAFFGTNIFTNSDYIIVTETPDPELSSTSSETKARVFVYDSRTFERLGFLDSPESFSQFGISVAIVNNRLLIGSPRNGVPGQPTSAREGVVYAYKHSTLVFDTTISAPIPVRGDGFGQAIRNNSNLIAIGAPGADEGKGNLYFHSTFDLSYRRSLRTPNIEPGFGYGDEIEMNQTHLVTRSQNGGLFAYQLDPLFVAFTVEREGLDVASDYGKALAFGNGMIVASSSEFSLSSQGSFPAGIVDFYELDGTLIESIPHFDQNSRVRNFATQLGIFREYLYVTTFDDPDSSEPYARVQRYPLPNFESAENFLARANLDPDSNDFFPDAEIDLLDFAFSQTTGGTSLSFDKKNLLFDELTAIPDGVTLKIEASDNLEQWQEIYRAGASNGPIISDDASHYFRWRAE